ncbi:MAG: excinuclease ABC subunit UvrC [Candidatus Lernaella stagnicola]|nr:excinuclease ABC subunit UvrC [Candidatus Lernaella stagnicola]
MTPDKLRNKIRRVPADPGVYIWKDADGKIIYVGKAKVLRNRVRSYFQRVEDKDGKTRLLVARIADLEWIVTASEKEALILEATLIQTHYPRYNIRLRDDKRFISLKLDLLHRFPRLYVVRKVKRDGNLYYGPYSDARAIRETMKFINAAFRLRKCSNHNFAARDRPCLQYQIGRCLAPCVGYVDREDYEALVDEVKLFFAGRLPELIKQLRLQMQTLAANLEFEEAALARNRIAAIEKSLERQRIVHHGKGDRDAFGLYREGSAVVICQLFVRSGAITGQRIYPFTNIEDSDAQILRQLIGIYYSGDNFLPEQILLPLEPEGGPDLLAEWLTDLAGHRIDVRPAQRGAGRQWVLMAHKNAKRHFDARRSSLVTPAEVLQSLVEKLHLARQPDVIECFDISNVQGKLAVGSQVRFTQGEPDKSGYRHYRVRTKDEPDDFAMMREVLQRRLARGMRDGDLPDLLLIDGGKGHLSVAVSVLKELGLTAQPVAAITKIKNLAAGDTSPKDKVYLPGRKNAVTFLAGSNALHLLQRLRDEAHRFAIEYHRKLRSKKMVAGALDAVPGLGKAKQKALLKTFGSVKRIRQATRDELTRAPGIGPKLAQTIHEHLNRE